MTNVGVNIWASGNSMEVGGWARFESPFFCTGGLGPAIFFWGGGGFDVVAGAFCGKGKLDRFCGVNEGPVSGSCIGIDFSDRERMLEMLA